MEIQIYIHTYPEYRGYLTLTPLIVVADVTNVEVTCTTNTPDPTYSVSGTISGLTDMVSLGLEKGGTQVEELADLTGATFDFSATTFIDSETYTVTITAQPTGQTCALSNDTGTINGQDITNVTVTCADDVGGGNGVSGSITLNFSYPGEFFDFSAGTTSADTEADIGFVSNEGVNFGNENSIALNNAVGRNIYRIATSGTLSGTTAPVWTGAAPWISVSYDFSDGTGGLPIAVGEIYAVYTREGNYAVMQITALPGGTFGTSFSFDYIYNPDGSRNF